MLIIHFIILLLTKGEVHNSTSRSKLHNKTSAYSVPIRRRADYYDKHWEDLRIKQKIIAPYSFPQLYKCIRNNSSQSSGNDYNSQSNEDKWLWEKIYSKLPPLEILGLHFIEIGALGKK